MPPAKNKQEGLCRVTTLVARYRANSAFFSSAAFGETATRNQFIDPLLEALGWDVKDEQGLGPQAEVQVENSFRVEYEVSGKEDWDLDLTEEELAQRVAHTRHPDYVLRVASTDAVVVEAKRPNVDLRSKSPAFQAKSYAWARNMPVAVLTNFERFRVFDGRFRPDYERPNGNLVKGMDLACDDYAPSWGAIWDLLSKDAVAGGSMERFVAANPARGAVPVDRSFLDELDQWRVNLATDLHRHNGDLDQWELAEATQRILDRVVFIRFMEDRSILDQIVLRRYARQTDSYAHAVPIFRSLDARFNGQLFTDHFCERLEVSDGFFQRLIEGLYPPRSPYRFDMIEPALLGSIYERFLGQQITIDSRGTVKAELKPELRHARGVYYTPKWVVDRIVADVVGPLVQGKTPVAVANVKILDPACGSGAFLLGVFDYLVRWHEEYYGSHPRADRRSHFVTPDGQRHLTADMKAQILTNSIFGVDIDPQAIEVTQMNLYLALLEHESLTTLESQQRLFQHAYLPRLNRNIRCGNSLLAETDLPPGTLFTDEATELRRRMNPFDWRDPQNGFGEVFTRSNGFHGIVGNPPYVRAQVLRTLWPDEVVAYLQKYRSATEGSFDVSFLFIERGLELLRSDGRLGYIVSRQFAETNAGRPLREILSKGRHVQAIVDFGDGFVFSEARAYTMLLTLGKTASRSYQLTRVAAPPSPAAIAAAEMPGNALSASRPAKTLTDGEWGLELPLEADLLQRLGRDHATLSDVCNDVIFQGVVTGADYVFCLKDLGLDPTNRSLRRVRHRRSGVETSIEDAILYPVVAGRSDIQRFTCNESTRVLLLPYERLDRAGRFSLMSDRTLRKDFPMTWKWLSRYRDELAARTGTWTDDDWWGFSRRQNLEIFQEPKILVPYMLDQACAWLDGGQHYFVNVTTGGYGIPAPDWDEARYVCALLNSRLLSWALRRYSRAFGGGWFAARKANLARLPITDADAATRAKIVSLFDECCATKIRAGEVRSDRDRNLWSRAQDAAVQRFDAAVEDAFGLTPTERLVLAARATP
jgi:hypothetical protein